MWVGNTAKTLLHICRGEKEKMDAQRDKLTQNWFRPVTINEEGIGVCTGCHKELSKEEVEARFDS